MSDEIIKSYDDLESDDFSDDYSHSGENISFDDKNTKYYTYGEISDYE